MPSVRKQWWWAGIAASIVAISGLLWALPPEEVEAHNFLHHLNFIPLLLAGLLLGWRAALGATLFAAVAESPNWWVALRGSSLDALDLMMELSIFGVAGTVAGWLADRERRHRDKLEHATLELRHVYQELSQNVEKLKKAERLYAAGQLSASLAHEIRNPLAAISGAAALLKRGSPASMNFLECLEIIEKESQRLNKLLSNFLEFARPRAPRFQATDVAAVIDSAMTLAAHMAAGGIRLERRVEPNIPEIDCDPEQLKQVLLNLLINAIQATPAEGVVEVGASARNGHVSITVRDEGRGLAPEEKDHIFDPFFTTKANGTGLGLAISAKIMEQHGGLLTAESNPDKGMTFRIELPVAQAAEV